MASIILPVPHILQRQPGECLAACAAMILTYLALSVNYNRLLKLLQVKPDIGAPSFNIRQLKTLKVDVTYKQGTLVELHDHLINNRPCLTFVQTVELPYWNKEENNHAVVVVGLDDDYVYVNDPAFLNAPIQVPRGDFDLAWLAKDEYYAVITLPAK